MKRWCVSGACRRRWRSAAGEALLEPEPITPLTALRVDDSGRLTYMGQDGARRVIVGHPDLLYRLRLNEQISDEQITDQS